MARDCGVEGVGIVRGLFVSDLVGAELQCPRSSLRPHRQIPHWPCLLQFGWEFPSPSRSMSIC